ncbi:MAG TPA: SRPBCC family protein [Gemmatimonadaceae bacterium]|nr:SRPBCC family protein [Gemmatimonadaceae bacterium]
MSTSTKGPSHAIEQIAEALLAGALFGYASTRRSRASIVTRLTGAALLAAAFAPSLVRRVLRAGAARRRVHLRTTTFVDRPVHEVFEFCRDFENFPRVIQSLHSVTDFQDGRSRWEVMSPTGELLVWDAQVTKYVPNVVIAWRSVPGAVVDCKGLIRFAPTPTGGTELHLEIEYDPCHTGFAEAVRALFDVSRKEQLEADLARANFYFVTHPREPESVDEEELPEAQVAAPTEQRELSKR